MEPEAKLWFRVYKIDVDTKTVYLSRGDCIYAISVDEDTLTRWFIDEDLLLEKSRVRLVY